MAQPTNSNTGNGSEKITISKEEYEKLKREREQLIKISGTAYSISGYPPTESGWKFTEKQICDIIQEHTKAWLPDVQNVSLDHNPKTGALYAYVWLPKNSKHVTNTELQSDKSAINRPMKKYSPQLKEFMEKFCEKSKRRTLQEQSNLPYVAIEVLIENFMKIELDENGFKFGQSFGEKYKRKTRITLTADFVKTDDNRFGRLNFIQATKSTKVSFSTLSLKPKRSYNAH